MSPVAIIAALDRELHPLVDEWNSSPLPANGRTLHCYHRDDLVAVAGGIGCSQAELAARAVMESYHPQVLVSAGLAGALIRSLKVGSIVTPNVIVDAERGTEYRCNLGGAVVGGGVLVTSGEIAGVESKAALVERFHALVVDMEAAGVARVAQQYEVGFRCVKAISDEFDFAMPPLNRFVDEEGNFKTGKFAGWAALQPQHWAGVLRLARNSGRARRALSEWLKNNLSSLPGNFPSGTVVTLNEAGTHNPIAPTGTIGVSNSRN
jgi:adenosylhomocysteine nucleosidase